MREEGKEIVCRIGPAHKVIGKRKEGVLVFFDLSGRERICVGFCSHIQSHKIEKK